MYAENEQVAVADNFNASVFVVHQQTPGTVLAAAGVDIDDQDAMLVYKAREEMFWPYDDRAG